MSLRYYLDEDISYRVAEAVRSAGGDAVSVREVRREARSDEEQLAYATAAGRVLVTYNRSDYQRLDAEWREAGRHHEGILWGSERIIPRRNVGTLASALQRASETYESMSDLCLPLTLP